MTYRSRRFAMLMRPCRMIVSVAFLVLMPAACGVARAQFGGFGFPRPDTARDTGATAGPVASSYGYGVRTGQVGSGYHRGGGLPAGLRGPRQAPDDDLVRAARDRDHLGPGLVRPVDDISGSSQGPCDPARRPAQPAVRRRRQDPLAQHNPPDDPGARGVAQDAEDAVPPSSANRSPPAMPRSGR